MKTTLNKPLKKAEEKQPLPKEVEAWAWKTFKAEKRRQRIRNVVKWFNL